MMGNKRYMISEASAKTGLETHVLRYWEEELGLSVPRNELGHRYYTDELLDLFVRIKDLKEKGYQLKAVKAELLGEHAMTSVSTQLDVQKDTGDKMEQFKAIIGGIVTQSLRENNEVIGDGLSKQVSEKVIKEMDYLLRMKEEAEEDRYKRLDETIRNCQRSNKEAAAASAEKGRKIKSRRK